MSEEAKDTKTKLFINNEWFEPSTNQYLQVVNPANEQVIAQVACASEADVDRAVSAAYEAFQPTSVWRQYTAVQRADVLRKIASLINEPTTKVELAVLETMNCGKPYREAEWDMSDVAGCFEYFAQQAEQVEQKQGQVTPLPDAGYQCELFYEPVGVVAAIIPWNYPLLMLAWKVAPALAAGCTVVLKPSELTPLTALQFAKITVAAGLPAGALNIITGAGETGSWLVKHAKIDKVAFTGSVPTGATVATSAVKDIKRVTLELGGKSPVIVFDDADIKTAAEWVMFGAFWTNGQICSSTSRLLIQDTIADKFLAQLVEATNKIPIVDPNALETKQDTGVIGPVVCARQCERVMGFINQAIQEGAQVLCGGKRSDKFEKGFYVQPTILRVQPHFQIWKEEVFGPVLSVMTFSTEAEALRIANDTEYGLAGAVISADAQRCRRIARGLRCGITWINCSQPCFSQAPWGGMKRSGFGRELGPQGIYNYLELKQITTKINSDPLAWYHM